MKILVIDGQGGKIGQSIISELIKYTDKENIIATGTNTIATSAMIKAGATFAATGENPVIVNSKKANIIVGPIGIISPNSLLGEITPPMSTAISESNAVKILIPINKCGIKVIGVKELTLSEYIKLAVKEILSITQSLLLK